MKPIKIKEPSSYKVYRKDAVVSIKKKGVRL